MTYPSDFEPFAAATIESPFQFYASLREHAPVYRIPGADYWVLSRYEDVRAAAMAPERFSSNIVTILMAKADGHPELVDRTQAGIGPVDVLAIQDPPSHGPQRKIVTRYLTRHLVESLEDHVATLATSQLTSALAAGRVDWMEHVAFHIPMSIALHITGLSESDRAQVKKWCDSAIALLSGILTAEQLMMHMSESLSLFEYCSQRYSEATRDSHGLLGELVRAVDANEITREEAVSIVLQILIAGSDSSASLMGSAARMLAESPELQSRLRDDLALIPLFLEESLRLESPFQGHFRALREPVTIEGVNLPAETRVMLLWGSANRDERVFEAPDEVRVDRKNPRQHFAFGHGLHLCLGAALARLEARVVIETLLRRTTSFKIQGPYRHRPSAFVRTLERLPLEFA